MSTHSFPGNVYNSGFGNLFAQKRVRAGLTQADLARLASVSEATIRNWELNLSTPKAEHLSRALEGLLQQGAFTEEKELEEARDLWLRAQGEIKRNKQLRAEFDEEWFKKLILNRQKSPADDGPAREPGPVPFQPFGRPTSRRSVLRASLIFATGGVVGGMIGGLVGSYVTRQALQRETKWVPTAKMLVGRRFFCATTLMNGMVLIEGGFTSDGLHTIESELFNPMTRTWTTTKGKLNESRGEHTATRLQNGQVLIAGGYAGGNITRNSGELYDPETDEWTLTKKMMSHPRTRHTATLLRSGKVLIAGGVGLQGMHANTAELYDPTTDTWSSAGIMGTHRADHVAVGLLDGKVLVAGGTTENIGNTETSKAEVYNPDTNNWIQIQNMNVPRAYFTAALLPTGKVLAIGGRAEDYNSTVTTELYDPITGLWSKTGSMKSNRENSLGQGAVLLEDDTVLVAGGDALGTSEVYSLATGTWIASLRMGSVRCNGATALLERGRVLVLGGSDCSSSDNQHILATAEVYTPS